MNASIDIVVGLPEFPGSTRIARLKVAGSTARRILSSAPSAGAGSPMAHVLGAFGTPRFRLVEPLSPATEAWSLDTVGQARGISGAFDGRASAAFMRWAVGTAAQNGGHVLAALPDGEYWLVRTRPAQGRADSVLLGAVRRPAPPNAVPLVDDGTVYAAAFGAHRDAPPSWTTPLVGLGFTGDGDPRTALFFELGAPGSVTALRPSSADAVVIVPAGPPLVVGARADGLDAWRERHAPAIVLALAR